MARWGSSVQQVLRLWRLQKSRVVWSSSRGGGQVGLADALRAHGVVAPATQVHLVGFFHVAINLHHVGGGGSVAGAGGSRQGSVDLAREVAGAQRVAAAGSGAQRPGQRPVLPG